VTLSDHMVRIEKTDNALETTFTLSAGLRQDHFNWSIAGHSDGTDPDILSELTWSHVDSYQIHLNNRTCVTSRLYLRGDFSYAWIQDGTLRDSDYRQDGRNEEYSRSLSDTNGDQLWDLSLAMGYPFFFMGRRLMVAPLVGGSLHEQNFRVTNGRQAITWDDGPTTDSLAGLNTTYRARWVGPWIGCDLRYLISPGASAKPSVELGLTVEMHWADFEATGDWNLRGDLQHPRSFEQAAAGQGVVLGAELVMGLVRNLDFCLSVSYQEWTTGSGTDRKFKTDGTTRSTRLNGVDWDNHSVMVGLIYYFF
jgi:Protochlamydia outer membrane protein